MAQVFHSRKGKRFPAGTAGILDYWVAALLAGLERAIRQRCATRSARMLAASDASVAANGNAVDADRPS